MESDDIQQEAPSPDAVEGDELRRAIRVLQRVVDDRGLLLQLSRDERSELLGAAGQVAHPGRTARRKFREASRNVRRRETAKEKEQDEVVLAQAGIRRDPNQRAIEGKAPPRPDLSETPHGEAESVDVDGDRFIGELNDPRNCYVCKQDFQVVHFFYDSLCPSCAEFNYAKREQTADLNGRYALVTGGRVKIGYYAALKLLQAGAHVVVTTRFPKDAAARFLKEDDSEEWIDRLQLHGLDLRHTPSVERFADFLAADLPQLDFVLNNACQTVRRPPGFYAHLMESERTAINKLPAPAQQVLEKHSGLAGEDISAHAASDQAGELSREVAASLAGIQRAAELSQLPLAPGDEDRSESLFPTGRYDADDQQVDLRNINSWRLKLAEVPTVELLEVQLVNAVAPFVLNSRLKPLMLRTSTRDKHIVNVSAMEGVFYRAFKRDTHPHTNMAKAALNMMTRTSALDYVKDGIHMNSVDTGWITDEDPAEVTERKQRDHGFRTPLDHIDAASRICDPIFSGLLTGEHVWGKFLKDYRVSNW